MTSHSPNLSSDVHTLLHKELDALLADCDLVAEASAHGKMLDDLDQFFFTKGRAFLIEALQASPTPFDHFLRCSQGNKSNRQAFLAKKCLNINAIFFDSGQIRSNTYLNTIDFN